MDDLEAPEKAQEALHIFFVERARYDLAPDCWRDAELAVSLPREPCVCARQFMQQIDDDVCISDGVNHG